MDVYERQGSASSGGGYSNTAAVRPGASGAGVGPSFHAADNNLATPRHPDDDKTSSLPNDHVTHMTGNDHVTQRTANDHMTQRTGNDHVTHMTGNDHVTHRTGNDHVTQRTGNNHVTPRTGIDHVTRRTGNGHTRSGSGMPLCDNKSKGGYPPEIVIGSVEKKHMCSFCSCILRYPVQVGCGERYCLPCSDTLLSYPAPKCPLCKEELDRKMQFRDMFAEREILSLRVVCVNSKRSCPWSGVLKDWEDHNATCAYRLVPCPNGCREDITQSQRDRHCMHDCMYRTVDCPQCNAAIAVARIDEHRREECAARPVLCPYCTSMMSSSEQLTVHLESQCPEYIVTCQYGDQGCQVKIPRRDIPQHMQTCVAEHLSLVHASFLLEKQYRIKLEDIVKATSGQLADVREEMHQMSEKMAELMQTKDETKTELAGLARAQGGHEVQMADMNLRIDIVDVKTTNGVLIWKIGDISRRRREAISGKTPSLYSAPFYTSPCGYKMCARVYLNGDGMGKNSHLSVFFVLMRGEYDALLPWPFQLRVTMMLIDQSDSVVKRNITEVFKPDGRSASFKRPISDMNTGSGCPMFAPVSILESPTYVKGNTLFIKRQKQ
ncbi:TNF receptor-associated factor 2-like isoform X2 [Sycon ciliatum]|uniref:TNF receptor-associated factor 2-like isoform X2 n=1 Tax=Sycon ciliatum TaxID=27933 RepID=UPI0031F62A82